MYKKMDNKSFVEMEQDVINLWKEEDVIKKSFEANPEGEYFTFYDGPPTANGKPHVGHVLSLIHIYSVRK